MSMITNIGAINALSSFRLLNKQMETNQMQISTGKRVNEAKDDYIAWSTASHAKSDIDTLSIVSGAMSKSQGLLGTTQAGIKQITNLLDRMNSIIAEAGQKEKNNGALLQEDLNSIRSQIDRAVESASFNGKNLLAGDPNGAEILSSFSRKDGFVQIQSENINAVNLTMAGRSFAGPSDLLDDILIGPKGGTPTSNPNLIPQASTFLSTDKFLVGRDGGKVQFDFATLDPSKFRQGDEITIKLGNLPAAKVTVTDGMLTSGTFQDDVLLEMQSALTTSLNAGANPKGTVTLAGDVLTIENTQANRDWSNSSLSVNWADGEGVMSLLKDIDLDVDVPDVEHFSQLVSMAKQSVIDAGARFGMMQNRLEGQNNYMKSLAESMEKGMSALVDADMEKVSSEMQSLQIRQQLAVQALSVSNQKESTLLSLFR